MSTKIIIDSYGVPSGIVREGQIESWDPRLDEALALPATIRSSKKKKDGTIIDIVRPGRDGDLEDILDTINLKGFYAVEKDIQEDMGDSTIEKRSGRKIVIY